MVFVRILCLGTSYTGRYAAVNFSKLHTFYFLSRRPAFYENLTYFDANKHSEIDCILNTVPPKARLEKATGSPQDSSPFSPEGENAQEIDKETLKPAYFEEIQKLLRQRSEQKSKISYVYISSTALFPTCLGPDDEITTFNEESQARPETERGKRRLQSEISIHQHYPQAKILRSTGIYGPGRSLVEQFQAANFSRVKCGNQLISRIHVHDLLRLAFALGQEAQSPALVHAVDQRTVGYKEVFSFLEKEFGFSVPGDWPNAPLRGRIIQSLHAKKLLQGKYSFPSYQEGFRAVLARKT